MRSIESVANAKINLSLDVLGKRPDGYHDVRMLMQTVELHDDLFLEKAASGIRLSCGGGNIPGGPANTAWKAAALFLEKTGIQSGLRIRIRKRIPVAAGLAGGSADAAAVLHGLDKLFDTRLSGEELLALGRKVGADVPFCLTGGTMLSEGTGEVLTPVGPLPRTPIVLVKPRISVSTAWAYQNLRLDAVAERPDTTALVEAVGRGRIDILAGRMVNVLESVTAEAHPVIGRIKKRLLALGALGAMMSGSGPSVFGIFPDGISADRACGELSGSGWKIIRTETLSREM